MEISDQTTCLDPHFASFEESLYSRNYKPDTLKNYRYQLRRFGRLLEAEGIAPSALTPALAAELGARLPTTPKSQIKVANRSWKGTTGDTAKPRPDYSIHGSTWWWSGASVRDDFPDIAGCLWDCRRRRRERAAGCG